MSKKSYHRKTKALAAEISRYKDVMSRLATLMRLYRNLKPFYKLQKKLYKRIQNRVDKLENLLSRQKTLSVYAKSKESSPVSSDTESVPLKKKLGVPVHNQTEPELPADIVDFHSLNLESLKLPSFEVDAGTISPSVYGWLKQRKRELANSE